MVKLSQPQSDTAKTDQGFSLVEVIVATALTAEVLLIALLLFDVNTQVSRVQTQVADLQQSQRVAHNEIMSTFRLAGRGGLPTQWAYALVDGADPGVDLVGTQVPVEDTDILTVRGAVNNPVWQVDLSDPSAFIAPTAPIPGSDIGTVIVDSFTPSGGEQSLEVLETAIAEGRPEALILRSSVDPDLYSVVEILHGAGMSTIADTDVNGDTVISPGERRATLRFTIDPAAGINSAQYLMMSTGGVYPLTMTKVIYAAVLEEYRYYIRDVATAVDGWEPKLSRGQFYPNTNGAYAGSAVNTAVDIAEYLIDLQIAEGRDRAPANDLVDDDPDNADDDWLFNHPDDDPLDPQWVNASLLYFRIQSLATTEHGEISYQDDPIARIENHVYGEVATPADADEKLARQHRRRRLATLVQVRNL